MATATVATDRSAHPMIPTGYHIVLSRAVLYRHCGGHDPFLLCTEAKPRVFAAWCPVCEHTVTGPTDHATVSDWNDHCIARLSGGKGTDGHL